MNDRQLPMVEQVKQFLKGSEAVEFRGSNGSREILRGDQEWRRGAQTVRLCLYSPEVR